MAKGIYERLGRHGDVSYYIRYQFHGTDIKERVGRKALGFTREMAKDALRARLGEIAQGRFNLEKTRKPIPFSKLAERYREYGKATKQAWEEEKHVFDSFAKLFGETPLSQISTWQIEKWKTERRKEVKPGTVNRQLTVIKHAFRMAVQWGMTAHNPASSVKRLPVNDQRTRFLTAQEILELLKACEAQIVSPWLLPLVTLALNTGMRQGELLRLTWDHVDLDRGVITVKQTKNLRLKTIAINEPARQALTWLNENRYGDYLFMWPWSEPLGRTTAYDAFKKACDEAKITDFRFHDLRHTFASHLVMAGVDLVTVKELLGHVGIAMTVRYSHLVKEHKAQAVAKLEPTFGSIKTAPDTASSVVSTELKEAINSVLPANLEQNRNIFLVRKGRGLKIISEIEKVEVARDRIELPTRGFSVLCSTD
jgi:integrase